MNSANELLDLASLTVLYVEDEIDIREELESFLALRVKKLYAAKDGKEGWELFQKYAPDIVISDINMPLMNGIEMSEKIKNVDKEVPIVLITAFSDAQYMMKAISAGVDKYVLKPIEINSLEETLATVVQNLSNRKIAEKQKKNMELIENLSSFLEFSPNPIIIFEQEQVKFANRAFLKLSKTENEPLLGQRYDLNLLFEEREGSISTLEELKPNYKENKVSIKSEYGRHILYLMLDEVKTESGHTFEMYTFNDVTVTEYQKLKIKHYNMRLEGFIKHVNTLHVKKHEETLSNISDEKIREKIECVTKEKAAEVSKERRELSKMEETVLKKSRMGKAFSAQEYAKEVDEYILDDIRELSLMENEIADYLGIYEIKKDAESLFSISLCLVKYSSVVTQLFEFEDLAFSIKALADLLANTNTAALDNNKHRKVEVFLSGLMSDLMNWRMTIFVDHSANDIHYLDASLFSAILQLELVISEKEAVVADTDDDDDFELF